MTTPKHPTRIERPEMFCPSCGSLVDNEACFCSSCGFALRDNLVNRSVRPPSTQQRPNKDEIKTVESVRGQRSEVYLTCSVRPEQAAQIAERILTENRFKPKKYSGESVWKKGTGMVAAMQFVRVVPFDDALGVQAWTQVGLGNAGFRESSLEGVAAALPKKMLLAVLEKIQYAI